MRIATSILITLFFTGSAAAQQTLPDASEPIQKVAPIYPPIAMAAHISGTVVLELVIDTNGHVKTAKSISGPAMLVGSAMDCVKQWVYNPFFIDGAPAQKTIRVSVDFKLPAMSKDDQKTAEAYFPASEKCRDAFHKPETDLAVKECSKAAEIAATFSDQERFIERRAAFVYAASAYFRDKQFDLALSYAEKSVTVVLQGHDDGSGSNSAYAIRAQSRAALGNLKGADTDLSMAEDFLRSAIESLSKDAPELVKHEYVPVLKNELLLHARILDALKSPAAADVKRQETSKL